MKKKKEEGGPASLEETHYRTLLQEALSFVLPERQAQRFTAMLLERFGSFAGVFLAPEEELAALLGEKRAPRYLRLTTELARAYLEDSSRDLKHVYDTDSAVELFRPKLLGRTTEAVCLMLLDGQARLLYITTSSPRGPSPRCRCISEGCCSCAFAMTPSMYCWPTTIPAATLPPLKTTLWPPVRWRWPWKALTPP